MEPFRRPGSADFVRPTTWLRERKPLELVQPDRTAPTPTLLASRPLTSPPVHLHAAPLQAFEESSGLSYYMRVLLWFPFLVAISAVHLFLTLCLCVTVVGIPLARTHYTLIRFAAFPMIDTAKTRDACLFCD